MNIPENYFSYLNKQVKLAAIIYVIVAIIALHFYSADEYYQIIGFARYKLGQFPNLGDSVWELPAQMRPALQPGIVYFIYKIFAVVGVTQWLYLIIIIKILWALTALFCIYTFTKEFLPTIQPKLRKLFILISFFNYPSLFVAAHFSAESTSGFCLLLAIAVIYSSSYNNYKIKQVSLAGVLFGFAFICRCQILIAILGIILWLTLVKKTSYRNILILILSMLMTILIAGVLIDKWFYGNWTLSVWNYFVQNILNHKLNGFGRSPWYFYILIILTIIPFGPLYLTALFIIIRFDYKNPVIWAVIPFIALHMAIGHKEFRFIYPIVPILPLVLFQALQYIKINLPIYNQRFLRIFWIINGGLTLLAVHPSLIIFGAFEIYSKFQQPVIIYTQLKHTILPPDLIAYTRANVATKYINSYKLIKCMPNTSCILFISCPSIDSNISKNFQLIYKDCYTNSDHGFISKILSKRAQVDYANLYLLYPLQQKH